MHGKRYARALPEIPRYPLRLETQSLCRRDTSVSCAVREPELCKRCRNTVAPRVSPHCVLQPSTISQLGSVASGSCLCIRTPHPFIAELTQIGRRARVGNQPCATVSCSSAPIGATRPAKPASQPTNLHPSLQRFGRKDSRPEVSFWAEARQPPLQADRASIRVRWWPHWERGGTRVGGCGSPFGSRTLVANPCSTGGTSEKGKPTLVRGTAITTRILVCASV